MAESTGSTFNWSKFFLIFFFVCFMLTMTIGIYAIFFYNANAPEPVPGKGHIGLLTPDNSAPARA